MSKSAAADESKDLRLPLSQRTSPQPLTIAEMLEKAYFAYIMASRSHTLYIGVKNDLHKRAFEHKWKEHDGFTEKYNCDRPVWFESYQDVKRQSPEKSS